jgi:hypothetical protein
MHYILRDPNHPNALNAPNHLNVLNDPHDTNDLNALNEINGLKHLPLPREMEDYRSLSPGNEARGFSLATRDVSILTIWNNKLFTRIPDREI